MVYAFLGGLENSPIFLNNLSVNLMMMKMMMMVMMMMTMIMMMVMMTLLPSSNLSGLSKYQSAVDAGLAGQDCSLLYSQCPLSYARAFTSLL